MIKGVKDLFGHEMVRREDGFVGLAPRVSPCSLVLSDHGDCFIDCLLVPNCVNPRTWRIRFILCYCYGKSQILGGNMYVYKSNVQLAVDQSRWNKTMCFKHRNILQIELCTQEVAFWANLRDSCF